ncbi:hypothetical protein CsSME_00034346 [Camellia sinensis var. sinensis]
MTVTQYVAKFEELARYATRYVENDEDKARKFEWGLDPTIRGRVLPMRLPTFADVVDTALDSEREVADSKRIWSLKKENNQSNVGPERNSQKHAAHKPYSREPQQSQQQNLKESFQTRPAGLIKCYHCQQIGHRRFECPQLAGNRGERSGANTQVIGGQRPWVTNSGATRQQNYKAESNQKFGPVNNQRPTGRIFALQGEENEHLTK